MSNVTAFLITVGESTTSQALERLQKQTNSCPIVIIENVTPMSAAFQKMIDLCTSRFFVEVDADMLLAPHALEFLERKLLEVQREDPRVVMYSCALYDPHAEMDLIGVKIYDHEAFLDYPYQDVAGCEVDQLARMKADGLTYRCDFEEVLGLHVTAQTPHQAFERYRTLMRRQRAEGHSPWVEALFAKFIERYRAHGNELDIWAALGLAIGSYGDEPLHGEKDASKYENDEIFLRLKALMEKRRS